VNSCVENDDVIVHYAAESHVDRSILGPSEFIKTNVLGTQVLLSKAVEKKAKMFLHVSTDEVYGSIAEGSSMETDPLLPNSPYSASKAASDLIARSYFETFGLDVRTTRCCNNYGSNQYPEKLIPTIIYSLLKNHPIPIYGNGKNIREWIFVKDHCNALIKISKYGKLGENYNIGSGVVFNNIKIAKKIISIFKVLNNKNVLRSKIHFTRDRPGHDIRYCLDSSKIKDLTRWECPSNFDDKIKETIIWYTNKFKTNYFKNKKYKKRIGLKT
jgi:dTDP-glucose 4,6-dehydratase